MAAKRLSLKRIVATNPKVDPRQIAEAARLIADLQAHGIGPAAYDLSSPFARQVRPVDLSDLAYLAVPATPTRTNR